MVKVLEFSDPGGIVHLCSGTVSGKELIKINKELYADEQRVKQIEYQICDLSRATGIDVTNQKIRELAEQDKYAISVNPSLVIAVIGVNDLVYGLARMWESYAAESKSSVGVFRNLKEACSWINKEHDMKVDYTHLEQRMSAV